MKKLLVYSTQLIEKGGIESHVLQFCNVMSAQGYVIDLAVLSAHIKDFELRSYRKACRNLYLNSSMSTAGRALWMAKMLVTLRKNHYDAIYTNGQGKSVLTFRKLLGKDVNWVHHHHMSGDKADRDGWPAEYRTAMEQADATVACSSRNAEMISNDLKREILNIPCFSRSVQKQPRPAGDKIIFGYFGRLIPEKGIDLICRLSQDEDLRDCEFHIWGPADQYDANSFVPYESVKYHGPFQDRAELENIIQSIDAFLLLSTHSEGLPISLLEVTSSGTPWIASDRGGISDIAVDNTYTTILSATPAYEEALTAVLNLRDTIKSEGGQALPLLKLYHDRFSEDVITAQWQQVLFQHP